MFIAQGAKEDKDIKSEKHPLKVIFFHYIVLIVYRSKNIISKKLKKKISRTQREFLDEKRKKKEFAVNINFQIKEKLLHH